MKCGGNDRRAYTIGSSTGIGREKIFETEIYPKASVKGDMARGAIKMESIRETAFLILLQIYAAIVLNKITTNAEEIENIILLNITLMGFVPRIAL